MGCKADVPARSGAGGGGQLRLCGKMKADHRRAQHSGQDDFIGADIAQHIAQLFVEQVEIKEIVR